MIGQAVSLAFSQLSVYEVPSESRPGRAARPLCCHLASAKIRKSYPFPSHTWQEYLESFFADSTCFYLFFRLHAQLHSYSLPEKR